MLTQVIHADNHCDYVTDFMLDSLIKAKEIVKFKSSTGWITIGTYPIWKTSEMVQLTVPIEWRLMIQYLSVRILGLIYKEGLKLKAIDTKSANKLNGKGEMLYEKI